MRRRPIGPGELMLILMLFFVVLLLASVVSALRRGTRLLRRVPCVACGCPLLPAARFCPNCSSRQPLRGWAGRRERMWRSAPGGDVNGHQRAVAPPVILHVSLQAWWQQPQWAAALIIAGLVFAFGLAVALSPGPDDPPTGTTWDRQSDGSYRAPSAATGTDHTASGVTYHDRAAPPPTPSASQPLNRMDRCVAMLGAQDVANGHVGGYAEALERHNWCEANWRSGK
jgi:hypothetical protein